MPENKKKKSLISKDIKVEVNGKTYIRNKETIRKLHREDPNLATFITFKPYYDAAGKELVLGDCEEIRVNMVRLGMKLLEIYKEKKAQGIDLLSDSDSKD